MKAFVGLGSNLGERRENLEAAARELSLLGKEITASPVFESRALLPEGAPPEWRIPYLNAVVAFEWEAGARELLTKLKELERKLGRPDAPRWAPRLIDLDLLLLGNEAEASRELSLPHPGLTERSFVLDPLKHLAPGLKVPGKEEGALALARSLPGKAPLWMGILNFTPDSFSDGGTLGWERFQKSVAEWEQEGVQVLDLGAESTRPGASPLGAAEEWERLREPLFWLRERYRGRIFRPWISVDTRHAATAERALEAGADLINDVSGLKDPLMAELVAASRCQYVLMHSLSVPAGRETLPPGCDPVKELIAWAQIKLIELEKAGVNPERVIFDPGIGFGKSPHQNLEIIARAQEFLSLPMRVLYGHSRKSFLQVIGPRAAAERDPETEGISLKLAEKGVEFLRVHDPARQARVLRAFREAEE